MKRKAAVIAVILAFILAVSPMAQALETRASAYISCYSASIHAEGNGKLGIYFSITGTGPDMDQIGVSTITIYEEDGTYVDTLRYLEEEYEDLMAYDTWYMDGSVLYQGVTGVKYYARLVFYVAKGEGSDFRYYFTNTVRAQLPRRTTAFIE